MKTSIVCVAVFMLFMALGPAQAHRVSLGEIQRSGAHWCNWSITSVCTHWRARGGKSITPCPPGNNWSSCQIHGLGQRHDRPALQQPYQPGLVIAGQAAFWCQTHTSSRTTSMGADHNQYVAQCSTGVSQLPINGGAGWEFPQLCRRGKA
jgi:hypothetical protein